MGSRANLWRRIASVFLTKYRYTYRGCALAISFAACFRDLRVLHVGFGRFSEAPSADMMENSFVWAGSPCAPRTARSRCQRGATGWPPRGAGGGYREGLAKLDDLGGGAAVHGRAVQPRSAGPLPARPRDRRRLGRCWADLHDTPRLGQDAVFQRPRRRESSPERRPLMSPRRFLLPLSRPFPLPLPLPLLLPLVLSSAPHRRRGRGRCCKAETGAGTGESTHDR